MSYSDDYPEFDDFDNLEDFDSIDDLDDIEEIEDFGGLDTSLDDSFDLMDSDDDPMSDIEPTHEVTIDVKLTATVEDKPYELDAKIVYLADMGELAGKSDDYDDEDEFSYDDEDEDDEDDYKGGAYERDNLPDNAELPFIGMIKDIKVKKLVLYGRKGLVKAELNYASTLDIELKDRHLLFNFADVFAFPMVAEKYFFALPDEAKMKENIAIPVDEMELQFYFGWEEPENNQMKISGTINIAAL